MNICTRQPPARQWAAGAAAVAILVVGSALTVAAWTESDWSARLLTTWFLLVATLLTLLVVSRWRQLTLIADAREITFGKRVVRREDVASISIEPVGDTAARFWLGVAVMALSQDISKWVNFRAADGRSLLQTKDIYGAARLQELAEFLGVPLIGGPDRMLLSRPDRRRWDILIDSGMPTELISPGSAVEDSPEI